jgi:hypothetical protein
MSSRIQLHPDDREFLSTALKPDTEVKVAGRRYKLLSQAGDGATAVVWEAEEQPKGRKRAIKFCSLAAYSSRTELIEENLASVLSDHPRRFAEIVDVDQATLPGPDGSTRSFVCFVESWVKGHTLADLLSKQPNFFSTHVLLAYVESMCSAIGFLIHHNLRHGDLHDGNVMIVEPAPGEVSPVAEVKIIDTGRLSRVTAGAADRDDIDFLAEHVMSIHNILHAQPCSIQDRRFLDDILRILRSMVDGDRFGPLRDPMLIARAFKDSLSNAMLFGPSVDPRRPRTPFDFIASEHIESNGVFNELFAQSCPFLDKVVGPDPVLLTGPRGCGKSTIFRWLSLRPHAGDSTEALLSRTLAGFYISCSIEMESRVYWVNTPRLAHSYRDSLIHYFNLTIAREVLATLHELSKRPDAASALGITSQRLNDILQFVEPHIGVQPTHFSGVPPLLQACSAIRRDLYETYSGMQKEQPVARSGTAFLGELFRLVAEIPFFANRTITVLLDDFSAHRIPLAVQDVLKQVIYAKGPHIFKISSEKLGTELRDARGATAEIARELIEVDCGMEYVSLDDKAENAKLLTFVEELLDRRLVACGYAAKSRDLLGTSDWTPHRTLEEALVAERQQGRRAGHYHGLECISRVCSGDVATFLFMVRRIFEVGNVNKDTVKAVSKSKQHSAIQQVSRQMLLRIRDHNPHGPQMLAMAVHFGYAVSRALHRGPRINNAQLGSVPASKPRIELDIDDKVPDDYLSPLQREVATEVLKRAIFIDMDAGRSRHEGVLSWRWHFRRVYLPAFKAGLVKTSSFQHRASWLKSFVADPKRACEMFFGEITPDMEWPDGPPQVDTIENDDFEESSVKAANGKEAGK